MLALKVSMCLSLRGTLLFGPEFCPYAPAILRFQISFPSAYPSLPPLIIFNTDIFHPLLTPLTTYTYTTGSSETETVSATDEERLPPGGFSLRHGFPQWFGRARKSAVPSATPSRNVSGSNAPDRTEKPDTPLPNSAGTPIASHSPLGIDHTAQISAAASLQKAAPPSDRDPCQISTIEVLRYMRSSFDTEAVLDSVPLEAAGNPGAWHAWRAYRRLKSPGSPSSSSRSSMDAEPVAEKDETAPTGYQRLAVGTSVGRARRPGEWNWEGVWELRVKKGVEASLSEPSLYGNNGSRDDLVRISRVLACHCANGNAEDTISKYGQ
ncbi:MAG: hypothetical protein M1819_003515 [Sarea resinae]|nr:MAG: hypothetical protein M1819_003515 [Sarea resinae]